MIKKTIAFLLIFSAIILVGCQQEQPWGTEYPGSGNPDPTVIQPTTGQPGNSDLSGFETSQQIKKINSVQEIHELLGQSTYSPVYYQSGRGEMVDMEMAPSAEGMATKAGGSANYADDHSTTNIQVENVDEADFIKNDGKYIYILSQDKFVIVDAYPTDQADTLSETEIEGWPTQIFLNGDKVVIFSNVEDETISISESDYIPRSVYTTRTHAYIYDVSDRSDPELIKDFDVSGTFYQARMIGDYVYLVSKEYVYQTILDMPFIRESGSKVFSPDVYYFDNPEDDYIFHTVSAFDINGDEINAQSFLMGYSNTLYVSEDNIYITYKKNYPYRYHEKYQVDRFYEAVLPLLPQSAKTSINNIDETLSDPEKWDIISTILEDTYNNMEEQTKEALYENIREATAEYDFNSELEKSKTVIHKIGIDGMDIDYKSRGEVYGSLLNQFSLDEYDGNLRVATNTNIWTRSGRSQYSNVFVFDEGMTIIGSLGGIAENDSIYSTRFVGEKLYMVTFQRIDPLFVIDLSDPTQPEILGELKIPGYSDYLHPYDENHIIGIGKETGENQWGGTSTKGVKISLFDVSDVNNPIQLDKYEIGTSGTDSEALNDHKAFLFDKKKNILVLPIREVTDNSVYDSRYGYYRQEIWYGAYVLGVTPEDGISLKGKVVHDGEADDSYYWRAPQAVKRSLYMDDVLYTVSSRKIVMSDLNDISEIGEIELPYKQDRYYPYIMY
ncbi:beta-propeller domain-containing protein [Candidatus Woesearchaeota archaeon]|nr:beta-propeller domain-containing protein [Candidatus Woesearchaeota archaeon]